MKLSEIKYKIRKLMVILVQARYLFPMGMAALLKNIYPCPYSNIWLVGANDDKFENNVRAFYLYLRDKTAVDVIWVTSKKKKKELQEKGVRNTVIRGSFKNYLYASQAKVAAYCHNDSDVAVRYYRYFKHHTVLVNLGHGYNAIKKAPVPYFHWPADVICAASALEKEIISQSGVPLKKIQVTGLPRLDYFECHTKKSQIHKILMMPTWRDWYMDGEYDLKKMELFSVYDELIEKIKQMFIQKGMKVEFTFIFHPMFATYFNKHLEKYSMQDVRILADFDSTQKEMKESDLLITDYSSVAIDYIYMNKPLILFWFDGERYNRERGIHMELEPAFKDIIRMDTDGVVQAIEEYMDRDTVYEIDRKQFFEYMDQNNCERLYRYLKYRADLKSGKKGSEK